MTNGSYWTIPDSGFREANLRDWLKADIKKIGANSSCLIQITPENGVNAGFGIDEFVSLGLAVDVLIVYKQLIVSIGD